VGHRDRFLERGTELGRILDRAFRPPAHRLGELAIVDVGIVDAGADRAHVLAGVDDAIAEVRHALHVHDFLVVAAVVVHHREQRNLVPRRRPPHAGRVHEIAIRLEAGRRGDRRAAVPRGHGEEALRGQRRRHGKEEESSHQAQPRRVHRRSAREGSRVPAEFDRLQLARKVKGLREKRKMSQVELAALAGTKQPNIARLESGKVVPRLDFLEKVARAWWTPGRPHR